MSVWQERRIDSASNETFKRLVKYAAGSNRLREAGLAMAEGLHLFQSVVKHHDRYDVDSVFLPEALLNNAEWLSLERQWTGWLAKKKQDYTPLKFILPMPLYKKLSKLDTPTGPLVVFRLFPNSKPLDLTQDVVVLDEVQDPGNVGTLLRNCAAAGIEQVVCTPASAWVWGDKALRAGMGAQFGLRFFSEQTLQVCLEQCSSSVIRVTSLAAHSTDLFQTDLRGPGVWVFGSEGQGVRACWLERASQHVRIAQTDWVESLNVASSNAICLFEQRRQRGVKQGVV